MTVKKTPLAATEPGGENRTPWRCYAWNGVRFDAPAAWEIARIGRRHLLLEDSEKPVLEIKWNLVKGNFSLDRQLRRLAAGHDRTLRKRLAREPLPGSWSRALHRFQSAGFSWQTEALGGRGAVIHCPRCGTATLVQFYHAAASPADTAAERLLTSFRDHSEEPTTAWSVFDIRAEVPRRFDLKSFRFNVGAYELCFAARGGRLCLYRWSPADALLKNSDLQAFGCMQFQLPAGTFGRRTHRVDATVGFDHGPPTGRLRRWQHRLQRRPLYRSFRLWHELEQNRLLAVDLEGPDRLQLEELERICAGYVTQGPTRCRAGAFPGRSPGVPAGEK
jgi:hypothetical protein